MQEEDFRGKKVSCVDWLADNITCRLFYLGMTLSIRHNSKVRTEQKYYQASCLQNPVRLDLPQNTTTRSKCVISISGQSSFTMSFS